MIDTSSLVNYNRIGTVKDTSHAAGDLKVWWKSKAGNEYDNKGKILP